MKQTARRGVGVWDGEASSNQNTRRDGKLVNQMRSGHQEEPLPFLDLDPGRTNDARLCKQGLQFWVTSRQSWYYPHAAMRRPPLPFQGPAVGAPVLRRAETAAWNPRLDGAEGHTGASPTAPLSV